MIRRSLRKADVLTGLAIALAGAGLLAATGQIRITEAGLIGPRFVPQIVCVLLILGGLWLALRPNGVAGESGSARPWRALILLAIGFAYAALVPLIGYLLATALAAGAGFALFGQRGWRQILIASVAAAAVFHIVFIEVLGLFMPRGRWLDLLNALG